MWGYGVYFLVAGAAQAFCAGLLLLWTRRWVFVMGILGNSSILLLYAVTRTLGVPFFGLVRLVRGGPRVRPAATTRSITPRATSITGWRPSICLPSGDFDIPLVIQCKFFNTDGSLNFPPGDRPDERSSLAVPQRPAPQVSASVTGRLRRTRRLNLMKS
jgi:hypothetical protein